MVEVTLTERKMKALQWTDNNLSEMKHFCGNQCTITYETCCVDDFWLLTIHDAIRDKEVNVPIGGYVVEYDRQRFTVMTAAQINYWFNTDAEICGEEIAEETSEKIDVMQMCRDMFHATYMPSGEKETEKKNIRDLFHFSKNPPIEDYKEPINVGTDGKQNKPTDIIPEGTKVKIVSCRHDKNADYIFLDKIGKVLHYWKGNPFGEYNVILDNGCNNCFDRDELVIIDETSD